MKNIIQKIFLIPSILITNIIILIGVNSSSEFNMKENHVRYTIKNENIQILKKIQLKKEIKNIFQYFFDFNKEYKQVLFFTFFVLIIQSINLFNIQPKFFCSTL